jgi:hypothetical protein
MGRYLAGLFILVALCGFYILNLEGQELAKSSQAVIVDDALPADSTQEGEWIWDNALKFSGASSHTSTPKEGINQSSFNMKPLKLKEGSYIIQYVYLDPQDPPKGIMMKFNLSDGRQAGVYWEAEEEVFDIKEEEDTWYIGFLPKKGEWVKLDIPVDDIDIQDKELTGISYIYYSGKLWWDYTSIVEGEEFMDESPRNNLEYLDYEE